MYGGRKLVRVHNFFTPTTIATCPFTSTFFPPSLKDKCKSKKTLDVIDEKFGFVGTFTLVFVCSCASPVILLSEFYLPFPFSLLSVCFHHFESEASRGYPMSAGVIQRHRLSSSSGKSSSPFKRVSSSIWDLKSNTRLSFIILSLYTPPSLYPFSSLSFLSSSIYNLYSLISYHPFYHLQRYFSSLHS